MSQIEFLEAVKAGNTTRVGEMLDKEPALVSARANGGPSAILVAAYYGRPEVVKMLMARGASLDVFEAAAAGHAERVDELLQAQPELANEIAADGFTPLGSASFFGHAQVVKTLLESGAQPNLPSQNQMHVTPLHSAAASRHVAIAAELLARGARVDARQEGGYTPLHAAAQNGQMDMVRLLLDHGAEINVRADDGKTPLAFALAQVHDEVAELLRERGAVA